jgi:hypothetical protein
VIGFDVAQICLNGHVINTMAGKYPVYSAKFCATCGEPTIIACSGCQARIRGIEEDGDFPSTFSRPAFCLECGKPYPWTERATQAAIELFIEESGFTGEEAEQFQASVHEAVKDGPRTLLAGRRIATALKRVGPETIKAFRSIIVDVLGEAAKKAIFPG